MYDSDCLSGVCHTDFDDEFYRAWRFHRNFWNQRYWLHQEAYLTPDGKIDFDRGGLWGPSIEETRKERRLRDEATKRLEVWREPTAQDIVNSSVRQFKEGKKLEDQFFEYEYSMQYLKDNNLKLCIYKITDPDRRLGFTRFYMNKLFKAFDIEFDGSTFKYDGKTELLMDLMESAEP